MRNIQERKLIEKFLKLNYPVHRVKHNMRFKRTIILDSGNKYFLSNKEATRELYYRLLDVLKLVFCSDESVNKDVLKNFLHLKENTFHSI